VRAIAIGLFAIGCHFNSPVVTDARNGDAATIDTIDSPIIDAPPICTTWQPQFFDPCRIPSPMGDLHLTAAGSPYKIDTTTGPDNSATLTDNTNTPIAVAGMLWPQTSGPDAALLSVDNLQIDGGVEVDVVGPKPLMIAAWSMMAIDGTIDAGSHTATPRFGAGANPAACVDGHATVGQDAVATGGSGGGGGGAFHGNGGHGSTGDSPPGPLGGPGGTGLGSAPAVVRGGCPGAASGAAGSGAQAPSTPTTVSPGGAGGGGLYLAARMDLHVHSTGKITSGGGAGVGAPQGSACGGGGGGAGGMLAFDARGTAELAGIVAANGGGGGGSGPFANFGNTGTDGLIGNTAAPGGIARTTQGQTCGVAGAAGSFATSLNGSDTTANDACGGGGGGGAAGFVLVWSPALTKTGTISPPEIYTAQ
jgi:hypothetical protein